MDLWLIVREGAQTGRVFRIAEGDKKTVGRAPECDIRLQDQGVSRRHCTVENKGAVLRVVDLESANGSFINGQLVESGSLSPGDQLAVGPVILECPAEPMPEDLLVVPSRRPKVSAKPEALSLLPPNHVQFLHFECPECYQTSCTTWEWVERASDGYDIVCVCEHCGHRWLQEKIPP